jgi:hypothetical protein
VALALFMHPSPTSAHVCGCSGRKLPCKLGKACEVLEKEGLLKLTCSSSRETNGCWITDIFC